MGDTMAKHSVVKTIPIEVVVGNEYFTLAVKTTLSDKRTAEQLVAGYLRGITEKTVVDTDFVALRKHEKRMIEIV